MIVGKASTAVVGPFGQVVLPDPSLLPLRQAWVIPEPELGGVVRGGQRHMSTQQAADAIAGVLVAQDITERAHEFGPAPPPWGWENLPAKTLGKSLWSSCRALGYASGRTVRRWARRV
jgi:2-keto-4-pentenoate hydratase/2-oxohepta-3-ene-1,7-dioic acid hydratase in catechol pathway